MSWFVSYLGDVQHAHERAIYLKGTMSHGLHYTRYPMVVEGYRDANWISGAGEIKAISGCVFTLGGGVVS